MFDKPAVPPTPPSSPQGPERRQYVRYDPSPGTSIYLVTVGQEVLFPERIHNISAGGIRLVLDRKLEPGTVATADLFNITRDYPCQVSLSVAYVVEQPDGSVIHGCSFRRILHNVEVWGLL